MSYEDHDLLKSTAGLYRSAVNRVGTRNVRKDFAKWFFAVKKRRSKAWTSREAALNTGSPMSTINEAFRRARDEGLVELTAEGWRWKGTAE